MSEIKYYSGEFKVNKDYYMKKSLDLPQGVTFIFESGGKKLWEKI